MDDLKIELGQIEETDVPLLKDFLNRDFCKFWNMHTLLSMTKLNQWITKLQQSSTEYLFSIKIVRSGDFAKQISGFCMIRNIDWIARHGELTFIMSDKHRKHLTIENDTDALSAFKLLISFCFNEINLNKVWLEVPQGLAIKDALAQLGFVAEGVRSFSKMIDGIQVSSTVFSLLVEEHKVD